MDIADETPGGSGEQDAGMLGRLPSRRPQNASRRRAASRASAESNGIAPSAQEKGRAKAATGTGAKKRAAAKAKSASKRTGGARAKPRAKVSTAAKTKPAAKASAPSKPRPARAGAAKRGRPPTQDRPPVPPQGYESDGDRAKGIVRPPGGADFAATALEALGELTRFSLSAGERVVRDLFGRRS